MVVPRKTKRIGLMGPFGYGNLGDAATQDAIIGYIRRKFPDIEICGFSLNPEDTEARHGIKTFPLSWRSWQSDAGHVRRFSERVAEWLKSRESRSLHGLGRVVLRAPKELGLIKEAFDALRGLDLLIVSGGGQLEDYWGDGPWTYPYTLLKWSTLARLRGTKIVFISVGAGPIRAPLSKLFIRWALSLSEYRSYRDDFSRQLIESIGFDGNDPVYPDLAFGLSLGQNGPAQRPHGVERIVAIGPIGYFKKGSWPEADETIYDRYVDKMTSFVAWLLSRNHAVVFLPGEVPYDQLAIGDLLARLERMGLDRNRLLRPVISSVGDLVSQLSMTDIVVASRFHGLLLAQALGKPAIGLSYQEKIDALMNDAGQGEYCFPIGSFEVERLKQQFSTIEEHYQSVQAQIVRWASTRRSQLEEQYRHVFAEPS